MRHIDFDPATLSGERKKEWEKWLKRATDATFEIISKWEKNGKVSADDFNSKVWADLKEWLLNNVFHGKCAYCETHIKMARQPGHAEHFRPKGGIKNKIKTNDKHKLVVAKAKNVEGQKIDHPGYFWLAYCWENIVPSCNDCNTDRGKNNQFPVLNSNQFMQKLKRGEVAQLKSKAIESAKWPGYYYLGPFDLDEREKRLLLHPYYDKPRKHITFGRAGIEAPKEINGKSSEKGEQSIKIYELHADGLRRRRHNAQISAWNIYYTAKNFAINRGKSPEDAKQAGKDELTARLGENPEYSVAIDDFIQIYEGGAAKA
jgi:hypothetical protein